MKRLLLVLTAVFYILSLSSAYAAHSFAFADTTAYARASVNDAYFFLEKDASTSLFIVPYTYCIRILRDEGDWYYASYASNTGVYKEVIGYCRKDDFTPLAEKPSVLFLYKTVTVTYRTDDGTSSLPVLSEISVEAAFYGNFYSGATAYSYVYAQGSFGYIKGATDDFPLIDSEQGGDEAPAESGGKGINFGLATALAICALAAIALIMLYFTSKSKNRTDG